jgi:hypothetical protein
VSNEYFQEIAMSNGNMYERLWKLYATACKLVMDGKRSADDLADLLQLFIEKRQSQTTYLRYLRSLTLAPVSGAVTIASAKDVFTDYLDPNFRQWGTNKVGTDSKASRVDVLEAVMGGTFKQLFGSLGPDPRSLCLSQGQIVEFCRTHREHLRQESYGTFFLFEVDDDFFVAYVNVVSGELKALVRRFEYESFWRADDGCRLIVRQQTV